MRWPSRCRRRSATCSPSQSANLVRLLGLHDVPVRLQSLPVMSDVAMDRVVPIGVDEPSRGGQELQPVCLVPSGGEVE